MGAGAHRGRDSGRAVLLYVSFGTSGEVRGGPRSLLLTAEYLSRYRPVFVVSRETDFVEELAERGLPVEILEAPRHLDRFRAASLKEKAIRLSRMLRHARAVLRAARRYDARIVHCQDESEVVTVGIVARFCRLGVILHVRDAPRGSRLRFVHVLACAVASRIICNSEALRGEYVSAAPKVLQPWLGRRTVGIPSGLDPEWVEGAWKSDPEAARAALGIPCASFVMTVVGPLTPKKNQLYLLQDLTNDLLCLDPDAVLLLVGSEEEDPAYAERCRNAIATLERKNRVLLAGAVPHQRMQEVYAATDVLVVPSVREGLPRAILEAQAVGIPVVASDIAGNAGAILDGETGYLMPLTEPAGFVATVAKLRDSRVRQEMGESAMCHARETFEASSSASRIERIYDEIG